MQEKDNGSNTAENPSLFRPPEELLVLIEYQRFFEVRILPTLTDVRDYGYVCWGILASIKEIIRRPYFERKREHMLGMIRMIIMESLVNAAQHGNQGNPDKIIIFGCWYGENGILFGIRDQGEFFTQPSTKEMIESRTTLPSSKIVPSGFGLSYLYEANKIYVDLEQNTLFLAILFDSPDNFL